MEEPKRIARIQGRQVFSHSPLDASDPTAIRLFRVSRDLSEDGLIQGEIIHANTDAKYTCLSYCWGPQYPQHDILIKSEGKPDTIIAVGPNLWEFLNVARRKFPYLPTYEEIGWRRQGADNSLWIDALCIWQDKSQSDKKRLPRKKRRANKKYSAKRKPEEQQEKINRSDVTFNANDQVKERNQQVQMMGKIYDQREVISWLGNDRDVSDFVQHFDIRNPEFRDSFMYAKYWSRAWITQELHLARTYSILLLSGEHELRFSHINTAENILESKGFPGDLIDPSPQNFFEAHYSLLFSTTDMRQNGLISILHRFRNKQSTILADRIYSIRALCREGEEIKVDYKKSKTQLFVETMSVCRTSLCFCSIATVASTLDITQWSDIRGDTWMQRNGLQVTIQSIEPEVNRGQGYVQQSWRHNEEETFHPHRCPTCHDKIPTNFWVGNVYIFCLQSVCSKSGHFFLKRSQSVREEPDELCQGIFYYQPDTLSHYRIKCYESIGISLKFREYDEYILRFSFASLIKLLRKQIFDRDKDLCHWAERTYREIARDEDENRKRLGNCEVIQIL